MSKSSKLNKPSSSFQNLTSSGGLTESTEADACDVAEVHGSLEIDRDNCIASAIAESPGSSQSNGDECATSSKVEMLVRRKLIEMTLLV